MGTQNGPCWDLPQAGQAATTWDPEPCPQGVPQWGEGALGVAIPTLLGPHPGGGTTLGLLQSWDGEQRSQAGASWEQPIQPAPAQAGSSLPSALRAVGRAPSWEWHTD